MQINIWQKLFIKKYSTFILSLYNKRNIADKTINFLKLPLYFSYYNISLSNDFHK